MNQDHPNAGLAPFGLCVERTQRKLGCISEHRCYVLDACDGLLVYNLQRQSLY